MPNERLVLIRREIRSVYRNFAGLDGLGLGQGHPQHAILELRVDLVGVDRVVVLEH